MATLNRGRFIAETLSSIVAQLGPSVEMVIVDGASSDDTGTVVAGFLAPDRPLRYVRETENSGVDGDYDKAVGYARGDYCWLMTDDDLMEPGAVARVLDALRAEPDLVVVNARVSTADFSRVLMDRYLPFDDDREYTGDSDAFLAEVGEYLSFIGGVIVKRELWMARNRSRYYGTAFVHVGVLFQAPPIGRVKVIAAPLVHIRFGNALWTSRGFEIWMFKWPELIWSFAGYSDAAKSKVTAREPWMSVRRLVHSRAVGSYSSSEYLRFLSERASGRDRLRAWAVASLPGWTANAISGLYCLLVNRKARLTAYDLSRSKHGTWISRFAARTLRA